MLAKPTKTKLAKRHMLFKNLLASLHIENGSALIHSHGLTYGDQVSLNLAAETKSALAESIFCDIADGLNAPQISDPDTVADLEEAIREMKAVVIALEGVQKDYLALCVQELGDGALDIAT